MGVIPGRRRLKGGQSVALTSVISLLLLCGQVLLAGSALAAPYTGGFSPTILAGKADLNGDGVVTGRDDSNEFFSETHIIDGGLDCNAWTSPNDGTGGDDMITTTDDCELVGVDGTPDGVTIEDAGSLNGTFVNRRRVERHELEDGDELQIGKYKLSFLEK